MNAPMTEEQIAGMIRAASTAFAPPAGLKDAMRARLPISAVPSPRPRLARAALAAAALCAVALSGWWLLTGNGTVASAEEELRRAFENSQRSEWTHMKGTVGDMEMEAWGRLEPYAAFARQGGKVIAADVASQRQYEYDPETRTLTVTLMPELPPEARQAPSMLAMLMAQLEEARASGGQELERTEEEVDGVQYTVYTITATEKGMHYRLIVDEKAQRIVRMESDGAHGPLGSGPTTMEFSYPETGPADIYELGVPRDAKVVEMLPSADLIDLRENIEAARRRFAPRYYAVIWLGQLKPDGGYKLDRLAVVRKSGDRCRVDTYVAPYDPIAGHRDSRVFGRLAPDDVAALESWLAGRPIVNSHFGSPDGRKAHVWIRLNHEGDLVRLKIRMGIPSDLIVEQLTWAGRISDDERMLPPKESESSSLLGVGSQRQGRVRRGEIIGFPLKIERFWNPDRDYALQLREDMRDAHAPWQEDKDWMAEADPELLRKRWQSNAPKMREYWQTHTTRVTEHGTTSAGRWYAKRIEKETISNMQDLPRTDVIVVHLDTERDIPDEVLDPDLVQSADDYVRNY